MKKKLAALLLSLCLFAALSSTAFSASDEATSSIDVRVTELTPGYYLCAVWNGDTLLCLFDYTVGQDGVMDTTVDIGEALPNDTQVKVGISSANTEGEQIAPIVCATYDSSSDKPTKPTEPTNPSTPTESLYNIYIPNAIGGTVTTSTLSSYADTYIPLIVTPSRGYVLDYIFLTDTVGNRIPVSCSGSRYWFFMPNSSVIVHVNFVPTASNTAPVASTPTSRPPVTSVPETSPLSISVLASKSGSAGRPSSSGRLLYSVDFVLSATVTGGDGSYSYQFEFKQNGRLTRSTGWTSSNVFSGPISGSGTCIAEITAKDSSGKTVSVTLDLLGKSNSASATSSNSFIPSNSVRPSNPNSETASTSNPTPSPAADPLSIGISNSAIKSIIGSSYDIRLNLAAHATGGNGNYSYKFEIL